MLFIQIALVILVILLIINIVLTSRISKKQVSNELLEIKNSIGLVTSNLKDIEKNLKDEFVVNRKEVSENSKDLREEVSNQLNAFTKIFSDQLTALTKAIEDKFTSFQSTIDTNDKESRKELK